MEIQSQKMCEDYDDQILRYVIYTTEELLRVVSNWKCALNSILVSYG